MSVLFSDKDVNQNIDFHAGGQVIISLKDNGDIYVKGNLIENDKEVVNGMRELLGLSNGDK
ncbi:hypothetical protein ABEO66_29205 [Bacillus pacificus]|uniref:hypothetical protein n=1 Tax=Bacillus pacificus TaxID=2026187 RepID=UPI000BFCB460|nr:hypothetical protein COE56_04240 [Bacillus anthracis]